MKLPIKSQDREMMPPARCGYCLKFFEKKEPGFTWESFFKHVDYCKAAKDRKFLA